jgi:outer membrane protein TolC
MTGRIGDGWITVVEPVTMRLASKIPAGCRVSELLEWTRMIRTIFFPTAAASLLVLFSLPALAQAPARLLTLNDCIRLAQSAPSISTVARLEGQIARFGWEQARASFLPRTRFENGVTYNSPQPGNSASQSFVALNGVREYASLVTTSQELDTSGRLRAELARARAARDLANAGLVLSERDLKRVVTAAYYRLLLARHLAQALRESLAEAENFEKRTRLLLESGEAARADVAKASAQVAFLRQSLETAELEATIANHGLAAFWTAQVSEPLPIVDVFEQPLPAPEPEPAPGGLPSARAPFLKRPEFDVLEAQRQGLLADSRRARAGLLPQASLTFQYGLDSLAVRIRNRGYAAFLNLDVPVFDWLKTLNLSRQLRVRAQQVETNRAIAERAFSRDYQDAQARVRQFLAQISITAEQIKLVEEDLRLSRVRYEGGEGLALDVVTAQSRLAQARANYFNSIANYLNAKADLEVASGR